MLMGKEGKGLEVETDGGIISISLLVNCRKNKRAEDTTSIQSGKLLAVVCLIDP